MKNLGELKGVGKKIQQLFEEAEIFSAKDLLFYLPRKYEDRRKALLFEELEACVGKNIISSGIISRYVPKYSRGRQWLEAVVEVRNKEDLNPYIHFVWFNNFGRYIQKSYPIGTKVFFTGKLQKFQNKLQVAHPEMSKEADAGKLGLGQIIPIYPQISTLNSKKIREIIHSSLGVLLENVSDGLPKKVKEKYSFCDLAESLKELHVPTQWNPFVEATNPYFERLVFDEFFVFSLAIKKYKAELLETKKKNKSAQKIAQINFKSTLSYPFNLTNDQNLALKDIQKDLSGEFPMHRLVQGDVGSGKTVVAFTAMIHTEECGYQAAMLTPTQILADQHYTNFKLFFPAKAERSVLLTGSLKEKEKKFIREKIKSGEIKYVFGTQALLAEMTEFHSLALLVIDEQHRFGVEQRRHLMERGAIYPHLLVMTATPIPRSLALTIYGDLDLSVIKEKPAGRKPIKTHLVYQSQHEKLIQRFKAFLDEGKQIYCVYPLVEDSELLEDVQNVTQAYKEWSESCAPHKIGLLHGRLKSVEKDKIMNAFRSGELRLLVSTTVIEVGVDVPNASVILIENAERFGLSQLHQLRGRVGRGGLEGLCVLSVPANQPPEVEQRLEVIVQSENGFDIAEKDLLLRGPGDFLGSRQSGASAFKTAHLIRDIKTLELAKNAAEELLKEDPLLSKAEHRALALQLESLQAFSSRSG